MQAKDVPLSANALSLFVFGPGFGESIVVFVPPNSWIVVDSLRSQTRVADINPAVALLKSHDAVASAVVLTHPHEDHVRGLTHVLDRRVPGSPVGCLPAAFLPFSRSEADAQIVLDEGSRQAAIARVRNIWDSEPASRWPLIAGESRVIGEACLEVLGPDREPNGIPRDWNRWSSPIHLSWKGCELLLGADLTFPGWNRVTERVPPRSPLAAAHSLKASHHGSGNAQHPIAIGDAPPTGEHVVVTPFNKGRRLPSYADGQGIAKLLATRREVLVTAVKPAARGRTSTRASLAARREMFGALELEYEDFVAGPQEAWVCVSLADDGALESIIEGVAVGRVTT